MSNGHRSHTAQRVEQLARAVEQEVVPRLILARRSIHEATSVTVGGEPGLRAEQAVELARLSLDGDLGVMIAYVETLHGVGIPVESLYLQLLAPAARHLGELWAADLCTFAEVTLGLMRLQQVMRALSPAFQSEHVTPHCEHQVLLTPIPGEQHSFGLFMVAEFFHRDGWHIWSGPLASLDELANLVRGQRFAIVGLSVSSEAKLDELTATIRAIRRASLNRRVGVMVGGQLFAEHPEVAPMVGADATAKDSRHAIEQAHCLLDLNTGCD
jgi:methanogenic corrinoid protein MtbC1